MLYGAAGFPGGCVREDDGHHLTHRDHRPRKALCHLADVQRLGKVGDGIGGLQGPIRVGRAVLPVGLGAEQRLPLRVLHLHLQVRFQAVVGQVEVHMACGALRLAEPDVLYGEAVFLPAGVPGFQQAVLGGAQLSCCVPTSCQKNSSSTWEVPAGRPSKYRSQDCVLAAR